MTDLYLPFASGAGANVGEAAWSRMARYFLASGVIPQPVGSPSFNADPLSSYGDSSGMQVKVRSGAAFIMGHYFDVDSETILAIASNSSGNPRIDRVVLRLSWVAHTIALAIVQGTPAASPSAPALTTSSTVWEIPLAQVAVANAAVTITAGNVTDERLWSGSMRPTLFAKDLLASASSIDIPSSVIPQTFRSLEIRMKARSDVAAVSTSLRLRFNSDTGNNYDFELLAATGTTVSATQTNPTPQSSINCGAVPGGNALANQFSTHRIDIIGYADAQNKVVQAFTAFKHNTTTGTLEVDQVSGFWRSNNAIVSMTVLPLAGNFVAGTFLEVIAHPK